MAFCVSYNRVTSQHINHMFSTKEFKPEYRRVQRIPYNPPILSYDLSKQRKKAWMNKRLYEHDDEYEIDIPRAPAFRNVSGSHMASIISRLTRPSTIKLQPRKCRHYRLGFKRYSYEDEDKKDPKEGSMSARDVKDMVSRLSQPRKSCLKQHYHQYQSMPELHNYEDDFEDLPEVSD